MSTVVYCNGALYADSRAHYPRSASPGRKKKLYRLADGTIIGVVSAKPGTPERFIACLNDPTLDREWGPDLAAIRVVGRGQIEIYFDSFFPAGPIRTTRHAIGSGSEYALGAILAGAHPRKAVEIAGKLDTNTGGPVDFLWP